MSFFQQYKRFSRANKIATWSLVVTIVGVVSGIVISLFARATTTQDVSAQSNSGPAFAINQVTGSTIVLRAGEDETVSKDTADESSRTESDDFSNATILAYQTGGPSFGFAAQVDKVWASDRVTGVAE